MSGHWLSLEKLTESALRMLARKRKRELEQEENYFSGRCPTCGQEYHGEGS